MDLRWEATASPPAGSLVPQPTGKLSNPFTSGCVITTGGTGGPVRGPSLYPLWG